MPSFIEETGRDILNSFFPNGDKNESPIFANGNREVKRIGTERSLSPIRSARSQLAEGQMAEVNAPPLTEPRSESNMMKPKSKQAHTEKSEDNQVADELDLVLGDQRVKEIIV